ncbi:WecB/TagA/CpsF family glycosyltransferase [Vibrio owensii]|uniref:WecB/TagA/CpsF family glycosyltransferase n=1 Tax=Vibrio owensii TaxID=696485 RepID=UPI0018F2614D|nr:WecB/TagA/CpsF family glycosyltransferase [Vibrio owensii]
MKNESKLISFVNPFSFYEMKENPELTNQFDGFFSDGGLLCKMHNLFNKEKIDRVSFDYSSVADDFLKFCESEKLKFSIVGATSDELSKAINVFKEKYPNLVFGYCHDGYFKEDEFIKIIESVEDSDVVIVAMGAPLQEITAAKIHKKNNHKLVITCGGFITQTSIKDDYYHPLIKKFGLRWLQRIVMHKHVRDKVLKKYPSFVIRYTFEGIKSKLSTGKPELPPKDLTPQP